MHEPGNGEAIGGFAVAVAVASLAALLVTLGIATIISLAGSMAAIFLGHRGKQKVQRGETQKHGGLAQAAVIAGVVGALLSIIATVAWTLTVAGFDELR